MPVQVRKHEGVSQPNLLEGAREALAQVDSGRDFDAPRDLLRKITASNAVAVPPGCPYSIATNVAHTDIWNCVWLAKLEGDPSFNPFPDFPVIEATDWDNVRELFLANWARGIEIANRDPFSHSMKTDESACKTLLKFAVHTSYHLGQIKLIKRILWNLRGSKT